MMILTPQTATKITQALSKVIHTKEILETSVVLLDKALDVAAFRIAQHIVNIENETKE